MKTRIIDDVSGLQALSAAWEHLEQGAAFPMQQFGWALACATGLRHEDDLQVLVLEDVSRPVAIAPLVHCQDKPYLEWLGVEELQEPTDALYTQEDVLLPLANALVN